MLKLGILTSHPIQYQAPLFRELSSRIDIHVYFAHKQTADEQAAAGFGTPFEWDVDLLTGYPQTFLKNCATLPKVNTFRGCDTPDIIEEINEGNFDAFLVMGWQLKCYWQAIRACHRFNVPVLVRGDSQLDTPRPWFKKLVKKILYRWLMRQFDGYLIVGQKAKEYLLHYGAPKSRMFFSPHFIDNEWFRKQAADSDRSETLNSLGCDQKLKTILFVGKFIRKKRPADLVCAVAILKERCPDIEVQVLFVGSGALEDEIKKVAHQSKVPVVFAGFKNQSELPAIYSASDLFVLPSDGGETWGLVVNESMACGTPAIVSEMVGCAPDLIERGTTGAIFPVGDIECMATAMKEFLNKKQSNGVQKMISSKMSIYSVKTAADGVLAAMQSLCRIQA